MEVRNITNIASEKTDRRIFQNFRLVWLDSSIDKYSNEHSTYINAKLQEVVNTVEKFTDVDQCINFITDIKDEQIFMICSGDLSQTVIPLVHDIPHIQCVYIFCQNKTQHEQWIKGWPKVQGIYTDVTFICQALKQVAYDCDQNMVSISFIQTSVDTLNQDLNTLDQSFMYTQILKEILLTIDFERDHRNEFLSYCREQFIDNDRELRNIDKIDMEYHDHKPIWWYTYNCFLYSMLNKALRMMEIVLIIKMGFFIRDLHNHILELHAEQYGEQNQSESLTVYRGQGLSQPDFDHLNNTQGGLLSFNNFLSTSKNYDVSLSFARRTVSTSNLVGVLFIMKIDPSISIAPFANVKNVSYYRREEEILFSMHSVFRIGQAVRLDGNDRLWQVQLTLTTDNDPQLHALTKRMQEETHAGYNGWYRLGQLMVKLGQFNKAEELYDILLKEANGEREKSFVYQMLGMVKNDQGKYAEAVEFSEKSIKINEKILSPTDSSLASSHNNIALVYSKMGEYSKALSHYEKALEIYQKTLPANHPSLATSYNNIGVMSYDIGEYLKALSFHGKALEIRQRTLPANHPDLAQSYSNIGAVYMHIGEYLKALSYYEKALKIDRKSLSADHSDSAVSYNNIGLVYDNMGEYVKALSHYEKALKIYRKSLSEDHPNLAISYNNIGLVYMHMGEYSEALSYYEKALEIFQKTLPTNHPDLATSNNNIGLVYDNMGEYSKALSYYEKALEIFQKTIPTNHPLLANFNNNIGGVYKNMSEYSKALSYYEKALEIYQKTLPANHPLLANPYNNIGGVYMHMGEYSEALSHYEKALEIFQKTLPANHPDLATSYNNISFLYYSTSEYSKALSYLELALDILKRSLSRDHPHIKSVKQSIEVIKKKL